MLDHLSQSCFEAGQAAMRKYSEGLEWIEDLDQIGGPNSDAVTVLKALRFITASLCTLFHEAQFSCTMIHSYLLMIFVVEPFNIQHTSSTAQGSGRSFKNRKPIEEVVVIQGWQSEATDGPKGA